MNGELRRLLEPQVAKQDEKDQLYKVVNGDYTLLQEWVA